jgi:hypothetical protein
MARLAAVGATLYVSTPRSIHPVKLRRGPAVHAIARRAL